MVYAGQIIKIIKRGNNRFVGRLEQEGNLWFVRPDGKTLHVPIIVRDANAKNIPNNSQVVVEIIQYPSGDQNAEGVIVEVLGEHSQAGVLIKSIIHQHHLPHEFDQAVLDQASSAVVLFNDIVNANDRLDLSDKIIITIDPDDARDFDDAISLSKVQHGWELGVHIADVSTFVGPDTPLDTEAKLRGNSVYFPGHVIPMLPETLSNGICSLQEGVPRLTKSVFIQYDDEGDVVGQRVANTIIRSHKRLTYKQASLILDGKTGGFDDETITLVQAMNTLARLLQKRRYRQGMLSLDLPTAEVILDEAGKVKDVQPEDQSFSHTIIEMFMVEANEAVARLFTGLGVPHLRRIHPAPEPESCNALSRFLGALGYKVGKKVDHQKIQAILIRAKGRPESFSVNLAVLRSLQPAEYSPHLTGHYALASKHYAHFTSPIRRYPDLTIHRLLDEYLKHQFASPALLQEAPTHEQLIDIGSHCSYTERRSEDAERELKLVMILEHLTPSIGKQFHGVVTGITNFGVFIQLDRYLVEGLVHMHDLPHDWWEVLADVGALVGERTGKRISIGDTVLVDDYRY